MKDNPYDLQRKIADKQRQYDKEKRVCTADFKKSYKYDNARPSWKERRNVLRNTGDRFLT